MDSDDECYYDSDTALSSSYDDEYTEDLEISCPPKKNYTILTEADISLRLVELIDTLSTLLSIPNQYASTLLRHYSWNQNQVEEAWFSDEDKVRASVGLLSGGQIDNYQGIKRIKCGICFEKKRINKICPTACGHPYCNSCWKQYVKVGIREGPGCLKLRCPEPDCRVYATQDMIYKFVDSDANKRKYDRFLIGSYVESNKKVKWCPMPGCEYAIELDDTGDNENVLCLCGYAFCWNCTHEMHRPVNCDTISRWMLKNQAESENTNWILAYTKPCPKCKRSIEKNEGCMHMTCRSPCKFEFCWLCLEPWEGHKDFYSCNKYHKDKEAGLINEEEMTRKLAKITIERYTHYYERWTGNDSSRKKAIECLNEFKNSGVDTLHERVHKPVTELEFVTKAWEQIVECRRVLKWTYAYGYYIEEEEKAKKMLFEFLQGAAEAGLERLHHCAEVEVKDYLEGTCSVDFNEFSVKLKGLTSVTGNYFDNLVKALEDGLREVHPQPLEDGLREVHPQPTEAEEVTSILQELQV